MKNNTMIYPIILSEDDQFYVTNTEELITKINKDSITTENRDGEEFKFDFKDLDTDTLTDIQYVIEQEEKKFSK
jgi:hypothetical protein